jgi:hypothetical protein
MTFISQFRESKSRVCHCPGVGSATEKSGVRGARPVAALPVTSKAMTALSTTPTAPPTGRTFRLPGRRLLLPIIFVMVVFSIDENKALELAESGTLWAFNLSARAAGRRKVHFFRDSIELYNPTAMPGRRTGSLEQVIASILPSVAGQGSGIATVRASELSWRWCLNQGTVANLIDSGELREVGQHSRSAAYCWTSALLARLSVARSAFTNACPKSEPLFQAA